MVVLVVESGACSGNSGSTLATGGSPNLSGGSTGAGNGGSPGTGGSPSGGSTASGGTTGGMSGTGGASAGGTGGSPGSGGVDGGSGGVNAGGSGGASTGGNGAGGADDGAGGATTGFMPCPDMPGAVCNIMPVGDSITEGCCTPPSGGYRIELYRQALLNQKNITFVGTLTNGPDTVAGQSFPKKHEGHGGWKISQIAGVIDNAIATSDPHIILLKIGTNDINGNDNIATAPNRLRSLIDQITTDAPEALLVVSAIIPTTNDGTNQKVQPYNAAIQVEAEAAAAEGKHVVFLDNYTVYTDHSDYKTALMADGLHPNTAGYEVLGQSFYDLISELLPAAQ